MGASAVQQSWLPGMPEPSISTKPERQLWERMADLSDSTDAESAAFACVARKVCLELSSYAEHLETELEDAKTENIKSEQQKVQLESRITERDKQLKVMSDFRDIIIGLHQRSPKMKKDDIIRELLAALYPRVPAATSDSDQKVTAAKQRLGDY